MFKSNKFLKCLFKSYHFYNIVIHLLQYFLLPVTLNSFVCKKLERAKKFRDWVSSLVRARAFENRQSSLTGCKISQNYPLNF